MRRTLAHSAAGRPHRRARRAAAIAEEDVATNRAIGEHGRRDLGRPLPRNPRVHPVQVLTHCNAGWLATVDWGTALAPIYRAHDAGIPVHVWVDEPGRATRAPV